jgi:hypothetical protein
MKPKVAQGRPIIMLLCLLCFMSVSCDILDPKGEFDDYTKIDLPGRDTLRTIPDKFYFEVHFTTYGGGGDAAIAFRDSSVWEYRTASGGGSNILTINSFTSLTTDNVSPRFLIGFKKNVVYNFSFGNDGSNVNVGQFYFRKTDKSYKEATYKPQNR